MKIVRMSSVGNERLPVCAFLVLLLCGIALRSQAQTYGLTNKNSSAQINVSGGVTGWQVDGVNQLSHSWFYYRTGTGAEAGVQNIDATPSISYLNISSLSRLDVTYTDDSDYSVRTYYQLVGQTAGTGKANLNETITIANLSAAPLVFHFFQYSDFNLGGVAGGQNVQFFLNGITGDYYKAIQNQGIGGIWSVTETVTSAALEVDRVEANGFNSTLSSLTDGSATTLNNVIGYGPDNVTFAYQWDFTLNPYGSAGSSVQISKLLALVPEPSSGALLLCGLLAGAIVRRARGKSQSV